MSLLEHPVVREFLHYKWRYFGLPTFMVHFIFYLLFVLLITALVLVTPLPQGDICSGEWHIGGMSINVPTHILYNQFKDAGQAGVLGLTLTVIIAQVVMVTMPGHELGVVICPSQ